MKTIIIDPGHGGYFNGFYCTAGKRSPQIPPGIFEGAQVRYIADALRFAAFKSEPKKYTIICPLLPDDSPTTFSNQPDVGLKCRRFIYNKIQADLLLSLHTNADGNGKWTDAHGAKVFFRNIEEKKATAFLNSYCEVSGMHNRGANENQNFTILNSNHPAVLIELGFHTHRQDVEVLKNFEFIANAILVGLDSLF